MITRVCLLALLMGLSTSLVAESPEKLFHFDDAAAASLPAAMEPGLVPDGQRAVTLNLPALLDSGLVNLPDGQAYRLVPLEVETDRGGDLVWHGRLFEGDRLKGSATFTLRGGRTAGTFTVGNRRFELRSVSPALQLLLERDPAAEPRRHPPGGPLTVPEEQSEAVVAGTTEPGVAANEGGEPVIDVLVFYTEAAASSGQVDEAGLRLSIRNALDATNTAYISSGVAQRVRLVAQEPLDFNETSDMSGDLGNFRSNATANARRDHHAADLAALVTDHSDTDFCGIAYLKGDGGSPAGGFSVTRRFCLGTQTLAHELGHNMGLLHDPDNSDGENPVKRIKEYSYGHRVEGDFRTIMAYSEGCGSCPQIDHFSNPDINTDGGTPTGVAGDRDNVRALGETGGTISAYRAPLMSLGAALNAPSLDWRSGGGALWRAQDEVIRNDQPVPASGPVFAGETSWIELALTAPASLSFEWMTDLSQDFDVELVLSIDGEPVDGYRGPAADWNEVELSAEGFAPTLRWSIRAPDGSGFDNIGRAYLANVTVLDGDAITGRLYNSLGQAVDDVSVVTEPESGGNYSGTSGRDGEFGFAVPKDSIQAGDVLRFEGPGIVSDERPAEQCLGDGGACEQLIAGVDRSISGAVSGLFAGESISLLLFYRDGDDQAMIAEESEITANAQGVADFVFNADSVVRYWRIEADVNGYTNRRLTPEDGFVVREGNLDGLILKLEAQEPRILNAATGEVGEDFFEANADIETRGRDQTIRLEYGQGSFGNVLTQNISGNVDENVPVSFNVSGVSCGSSYQWRMVATSDHGAERTSATRDAQTTACTGGGGSSSSSGCSIGAQDADRMDPLMPLLFLLVLAGLWSRRRTV